MNSPFTKTGIINEITFLYELALSIGNSNNLYDNCNEFLSTIMERRNVEMCSVWIKPNYLTAHKKNKALQANELLMVFGHPELRFDQSIMPEHERLKTVFKNRKSVAIRFPNPRFNFLLDDKTIEKGVLALYKLRKIGYLKLFFPSTSTIDEITLNQLNNVIDKFAIAIEGCLAHERLIEAIAHREKAVEELTLAKNVAEEARKAEEQFLAMISHEMRTPLNAIVGMSELLVSMKMVNTVQKEYLTTIKQSAGNLVSLTNNILDFSKIKANRMDFEASDFHIGKVVKNTLATIKQQAIAKQLTLNSTFDTRLPDYVNGDAMRLQQVLLNLLSNAIKFTQKGEIGLAVTWLKQQNGIVFVKFEVSDTGIGIPTDKQTKIFDRFYQINSFAHRKYQGTGLGLNIVQQLVEQQGGSISVWSKPDIGSVFTVVLPYTIALNPPGAHEVNIFEGKDLEGLPILLVEDNKVNQRVASQILEQWNAKVFIANHGREAIDILEKETISIVLLDIQMPVMDGFETATYIRNNMSEQLSSIPIIALSASAHIDKQQFIRAGMNDCIFKPFDSHQLYSSIVKLHQLNPSTMIPLISFTQKSLIDLKFIKNISNNDSTFIVEMLEIFIQQTDEIITDLPSLYEQKDFRGIRNAVHKYKSSARNMGSAIVQKHCNHIESIIEKKRVTSALTTNITQLVNLCQQVNVIAHQHLAYYMTEANK